MENELSPVAAFIHFYENWYRENRGSLTRNEQKNLWAARKNIGILKREPSSAWIRQTLEKHAPDRYRFEVREVVFILE